MDGTPFVPVGRIVKVHGTGGEVSVAPVSDPAVTLHEGLELWIIPPPTANRSGKVQSVRPGPKGSLVKIAGIEDRATAEALRGRTLVARAEDLPKEAVEEALDEKETDIGLSVVDEERGMLGRVDDVIETGANAVWLVDGGPFGQVLIPVIDTVILEVDRERRTARVRLLPGLIDEGSSR